MELLVVVSILVILTGVITITVQTVMAKARDDIRFNDMQTLKLAMISYAEANGHFPMEADDYGGNYTNWQPHSNNPNYNKGLICASSGCGHVNSVMNQLIEEYLGAKLEDPKHAFTPTGKYYYYDGRHACSRDGENKAILISMMETDKYTNYATEVSPLCNDGSWSSSMLEGFGREGSYDFDYMKQNAYIIILGASSG